GHFGVNENRMCRIVNKTAVLKFTHRLLPDMQAELDPKNKEPIHPASRCVLRRRYCPKQRNAWRGNTEHERNVVRERFRAEQIFPQLFFMPSQIELHRRSSVPP